MYIKSKFLLVSMTMLLANFVSANAQKTKGYSILGHVKGLQEGEKVMMKLSQPGFHFTNKDSAYVRNGEFRISGVVPDGPQDYWLKFEGTGKVIPMVIDNNEEITLRCDSDIRKIDHAYIQHFVNIDGSPTNHAMICFDAVNQFFYQLLADDMSRLQKVRDSNGFDPKAVGALIEEKNRITAILYYTVFVHPEIDYLPGIPSFIDGAIWERTGHSAFWGNVYDNLNEHLKNSYYGKKLGKEIKLCVGQPFPEFTLPTPEGKSLAIRDITAKSKITVVQFWASNSVDAIKYQDELAIFYRKYHNKGLNIVGVSSDTSSKKWRIAVSGLPWDNVSDLKGGKGVVENVYREYGYPDIPNTTNVVIDEKGKIVAWDVNGVELQYYLWKALGD